MSGQVTTLSPKTGRRHAHHVRSAANGYRCRIAQPATADARDTRADVRASLGPSRRTSHSPEARISRPRVVRFGRPIDSPEGSLAGSHRSCKPPGRGPGAVLGCHRAEQRSPAHRDPAADAHRSEGRVGDTDAKRRVLRTSDRQRGHWGGQSLVGNGHRGSRSGTTKAINRRTCPLSVGEAGRGAHRRGFLPDADRAKRWPAARGSCLYRTRSPMRHGCLRVFRTTLHSTPLVAAAWRKPCGRGSGELHSRPGGACHEVFEECRARGRTIARHCGGASAFILTSTSTVTAAARQPPRARPGPVHTCNSIAPGALNPAVTQATIRSTICSERLHRTRIPPVHERHGSRKAARSVCLRRR